MVDNSRKTAGTERLTREAILIKALEIADEEGIENLSMRKLACALGKTTMAPYRHFESMADIHQGMLALAFREVDTAPIPGERWEDTLRRTTASIRRMYLNHAKAHLHLIRGQAWTPGLREHTDRVQKLHRDQGIPEHLLMPMWRIVDAFLTGFIANEFEEMETPASRDVANPPSWMATPAEAYSDKAFEDDLEIIIAGIKSIAAPDPCVWRTPAA